MREFCSKAYNKDKTIITYNECLLMQNNRAIPYYILESKQPSIFGGSFVYTTNKNFKNVTNNTNPIPVHDYLI